MNKYIFAVAALLFVGAQAQYEAGFVKILEDQRYQNGGAFGNYRNQEDGIKYKEETDPTGIRRGSWEYPDENGVIRRVEFEAGAGIGFRIISSNIVAPTPISNPQPSPLPAAPRPSPTPIARAPAPRIPAQRPTVLRAPAKKPILRTPPRKPAQQTPTLIAQPLPISRPTTTEGPINLFDYPANLQFFRDNSGHRFKFSAV